MRYSSMVHLPTNSCCNISRLRRLKSVSSWGKRWFSTSAISGISSSSSWSGSSFLYCYSCWWSIGGWLLSISRSSKGLLRLDNSILILNVPFTLTNSPFSKACISVQANQKPVISSKSSFSVASYKASRRCFLQVPFKRIFSSTGWWLVDSWSNFGSNCSGTVHCRFIWWLWPTFSSSGRQSMIFDLVLCLYYYLIHVSDGVQAVSFSFAAICSLNQLLY